MDVIDRSDIDSTPIVSSINRLKKSNQLRVPIYDDSKVKIHGNIFQNNEQDGPQVYLQGMVGWAAARRYKTRGPQKKKQFKTVEEPREVLSVYHLLPIFVSATNTQPLRNTIMK